MALRHYHVKSTSIYETFVDYSEAVTRYNSLVQEKIASGTTAGAGTSRGLYLCAMFNGDTMIELIDCTVNCLGLREHLIDSGVKKPWWKLL